ncbi:MAG: hypothetical protein ACRCW9_05875 [Cetobacterium sp.]
MKEIIKWSNHYFELIITKNFSNCINCLLKDICDETSLNFKNSKATFMCPYVCADEYIPITDPREILILKFEDIKEIAIYKSSKDITEEILLENKKRLGLKP